jgi:hypothetical protein
VYDPTAKPASLIVPSVTDLPFKMATSAATD